MERSGFLCLPTYVLFLTFSSTCGLYLIADYYMDPDIGNAFGGVCNKRVEDACAFLNSHMQWFGLADYSENVDCTMTFDAGKMAGAKFKFDWQYFNVEGSVDCTKDYLAIYDADMAAINSTNLVGKFCGLNGVSFNGTPTDRYMTFVFHTDGGGSSSGFRLQATRYEPSPCQSDEFFCNDTNVNNICIDERLKCDGTQHCTDNSDEQGCTTMEEIMGSFFALGLGGMVMSSLGCIGGCVALWSVVGAFTCCKKCCHKCCCCWPCCKKCRKGEGSGKVNPDMDGMDMDEQYPDGESPPPKYDENGDVVDVDEFNDDISEKNLGSTAQIGSTVKNNMADVE